MRHPGPVNEPRIVVEQSPFHPEFRVVLPAGVDLLVGLCEALAAPEADVLDLGTSSSDPLATDSKYVRQSGETESGLSRKSW